MTFIPADSLTFHCRKCSGTINESNLSSSVGSDPALKALKPCCRQRVAVPRLACGDAPPHTPFINVTLRHLCLSKAQRSNVCRGKHGAGLFTLQLSHWISVLWGLCAVVWRCGYGYISIRRAATRLLLRDHLLLEPRSLQHMLGETLQQWNCFMRLFLMQIGVRWCHCWPRPSTAHSTHTTHPSTSHSVISRLNHWLSCRSLHVMHVIMTLSYHDKTDRLSWRW